MVTTTKVLAQALAQHACSDVLLALAQEFTFAARAAEAEAETTGLALSKANHALLADMALTLEEYAD